MTARSVLVAALASTFLVTAARPAAGARAEARRLAVRVGRVFGGR